MNRTCIGRRSVLLAGFLATAACGELASGEDHEPAVGVSEQSVSLALLQSRSSTIKSVHASHAYIHNPLIFAGIAYTETGMAHCYSEYYSEVSSYVCAGPTSSDCGGAVTAGYWDGLCSEQKGGLGMWQFDEDTHALTLNKWTTTGYWNGQTHNILSVSGSTSAAIDFVLFKAWNSNYTPFFPSTQAMYDWINSIRPVNGNSDYETWLGFLSNSYNGQPWGSADWNATKEQYRSGTAYLHSALGGDAYWYGATPPPQTNNASVSISSTSFLMPGQIKRVSMNATNTGTSTWSGGGVSSAYRLASQSGNGFVFSAFPQCGGYHNSNADARIYTCNNVTPGSTRTYQLDARAPTAGTSATLQVRMVQEQVGLFGNTASSNTRLGTAYCGTAVTQCILDARPDILPFYQSNGWSTACWNRDNIVANWCGIDPAGCNNLKNGACAAFNNTCRCSGGTHLGGAAIDPNGTFCGYKVCGTDRHIYECQAGWVYSSATCN